MKEMWHITTATKTHSNHNSKINTSTMLNITITSWTEQQLQHQMRLVGCQLIEDKYQTLETQLIIYSFLDRWDSQRLIDSQMLLVDPKASSLWIWMPNNRKYLKLTISIMELAWYKVWLTCKDLKLLKWPWIFQKIKDSFCITNLLFEHQLFDRINRLIILLTKIIFT